jgi:DDE_Tnp_1-associated
MGPASEAFGGAIGERVVFLDHFKDLPDPRQCAKIIYPLAEVLLLCLLAVLCGTETFVDIARFGEKKIDLLRRSDRFVTGCPPTITSLIFLRRSMPGRFSGVSFPG